MGYALSAPRVERAISGVPLSVIQPFAAGHVLTDLEAASLNQTFAENIGNNFRSFVDKAEVKTPDALQPALDQLMSSYEFYKRGGGGGRAVDPVEREARQIGLEAIKQKLAEKGQKVKAEDLKALLDKHWDKFSDRWLAAAEKAIAQRKKNAANADLELDI